LLFLIIFKGLGRIHFCGYLSAMLVDSLIRDEGSARVRLRLRLVSWCD